MAGSRQAEAYLGSLPAGANSYPQCLVKGWFVNGVLRGEAMQDALPATITKHLQPPPLASAWINQVAFHAAWLAALDRFTDAAAATRWWTSTAQRLVTTAFARPMLQYTQPERFLERLPANWELLYKASSLTVEHTGASRVSIKLAYPKGSFPRGIAVLLPSIVHAGLQSSTAREPVVRLAGWNPTQADYVASWSKQETPAWPTA